MTSIGIVAQPCYGSKPKAETGIDVESRALYSSALRRFIVSHAADLFVWTVWLAMTLAALGFTWRFGSAVVPRGDEWGYLKYVSGAEPITPTFLWQQHVEHRIPVAKLIWVETLRLTDGNFRAGMLLNVALLSGLALGLIHSAKRQRGGASVADAFFPMLLLHWGLVDNFLWAWQINEILPSVIVCAVMAIIASSSPRLTLAPALAVGICLMMLPLNGPSGLPYVLPLAPWLVWWCWTEPRSAKSHRWAAATICVVPVIALALVGLYFLDLRKPNHPQSPGWQATLQTVLQFLSTALGLVPQEYWAYAGIGVALLLLISGARLIAVGTRQPGVRVQTIGFSLCLGAFLVLALGLGHARAGFGEYAGLTPHYVIFAAPGLCLAYLIWGIPAPTRAGRWVQGCLCVLTLALLPVNTTVGLQKGRFSRKDTRGFERDMLGGLSASGLADRYKPVLMPGPNDDDPAATAADRETIAEGVRALQRGKVGRFAGMPHDQGMQEN